MAKRLTEEMVIARTKISDLSKIKRLNCWGSELVDVSLLRKILNVEVLSLSINKINSLADFQFCKRLEELYIRQNDIRDLNELVYLQNLPNLKNLWLGENPCCNFEGYRLAVIKTLPQLQKLDNLAISEDELREAQRRGKTLCHPDDAQEEIYSPSPPQQQYNRYQEDSEPEYRSPQHERRQEQRRSYSPEEQYIERRRNSYERETPRQAYEEYTNGDRYIQQYSRNEGNEVTSNEKRYSCQAATHRPPFSRRPVARNSNILSAVLCLVKELDYPSLEVVEMAVRCRMDELDE
ncbi:unnamed protein product [Ceutorhynchus assimilis]|uniref:U2A'/phosphoprotein 32 family A C-terminal domain-containing protein n=1 Tax=Ceutorhynchus assimilis TaxID=467358 RepID=A0A9P0DCH2_9CUCU|nr:unnamed protein product [Ceutorhynchus assimilis]